jgi:segregation and condensation protein A
VARSQAPEGSADTQRPDPGPVSAPGATGARGLRPTGEALDGPPDAVFSVHLDVFEGPFDLLLALISKHQLDVTSVALSQVTDEFLAHTRALGASWDLEQVTDFLVVAATLLDLKAARLLPAAEVEDEEDLALLEARDLLFARLLQYRAYKQAAAQLEELFADQAQRFPRRVSLEPRFAGLLPEVLLGLGPDQFARLAARTLTPRPQVEVEIGHVHGGAVSVREQTALLRDHLRRAGAASFRTLTADCAGTLEVVARFLGLLELFREGVVSFEQLEALGDLHVRWTGSDEADESPAEPDQASPAQATPAQATPAQAGPGQANTDTGTGDVATPDGASPDSATPDSAIPDRAGSGP